MEYRCPTDDLIFETLTDHRKPGALASGKFPAHPANGHPDCPKCQERAAETTKASSQVNRQTTNAPAKVNRNAGIRVSAA
jgi:hypothetical protein